MKRFNLLVIALAVALIALPAAAFAAGYDEPVGGVSPHAGWTTTSDQCNQCHATHQATGNRMLLRSRDSRYNDCSYCHLDGSAGTGYDVYTGAVVNGHTLGSVALDSKNATGGARPTRFATDGSVIIPDKDLQTTAYRGGTIAVNGSNASIANTGAVAAVTAGVGTGLRTNSSTTFNCNGCHMAHANPSKLISWQFESLNPNARTRNPTGLYTYYGPDAPNYKKVGASTYTAQVDTRTVNVGSLSTKLLLRDTSNKKPAVGRYNYSEAAATASGTRKSALTQWCAGCHNMNVAGPGLKSGETTTYASMSGKYSHSTAFSESGQTRAIAIDATKFDVAQYPLTSGAPACYDCHVGSDQAWSDWPHTGGEGTTNGTANSYALLKPLQVKMAPGDVDGRTNAAMSYDGTDASIDTAGLDGVCRSCHAVVNRDPSMITFDNSADGPATFNVIQELQP